MAELLKVDKLRAGYGEAVVLHEVSLTLGEGQTPRCWAATAPARPR